MTGGDDEKQVRVMDVTLREGHYVVQPPFTPGEAREIARALDRSGVRYIEVGNGAGLGAPAAGGEGAIVSDLEVFDVVAGCLTTASMGTLGQPRFARNEHVREAAERGVRFLRVAVNATDAPEAWPLIEYGRELGLLVTCNLMKSYVLDPTGFARAASGAGGVGAEVVYLVDSAGGMLPPQVHEYCRAARDASSVRIGFHGHDNLGLAVANALSAVEAGASYVDGSLQGLGRSGGNAPLEMLVAALQRAGIATGIELMGVLDAGEDHARGRILEPGIRGLAVAMGAAQFHSANLPPLEEVAARYAIDVRALIREVSLVDRVGPPRTVVEDAARRLVDPVSRPPRSTDPRP